jgi:NAD(P)-dependent dehydrogenase (short-subunit alcohol dehydrogenase family)
VAIALVTGTSSGIGLATAVTLARGGHKVIATMRNLDGAGELRNIVSAEGLLITLATLNVDDDASVNDAVGKVACGERLHRRSSEQRGCKYWGRVGGRGANRGLPPSHGN